MKNFKLYLLTIITLLILVSCKNDDNPTEPKIPEEKGTLSGTPCPDIPTVVYGGQTYHTVQIGNQCWFKENLNIGTMIKGTERSKDNGVIEKYCYDDDTSNCTNYGGLYEWNEVMQYVKKEGAKGICPSGWHIPTKAEFEALDNYIDNEAAKLIDKSESDNTSSYKPTNETGFSALFTGIRDTINGDFFNQGKGSIFWSSTEGSNNTVYYMDLFCSNRRSYFNYNSKNYGFSVRCVKD